MKKLLLISFLFFGSIINAQWIQQHSDVYQYYNTIFFIDSLNGWVGGYENPGPHFILKTTDGGDNWTQSGINGTPASLSFVNISLGFCAAYNGIYKTTDGGLSWNLNYQDNNFINSIEFINNNLGYAIGLTAVTNDLYFYNTQDGGTNWSNVFVGTDLANAKIEMINELTGFIIAESKIFKTNDGGTNWQIVYQDSIPSHAFWAISFWNNLNGLAAGAGTGAIITSDGGNTWHKKFMPLLFCTNIKTIENHCWASGFGIGYNAIVYSDDYGNTWTPIFVNDSSYIQDIFFSDLNNGWSCAYTNISAPIYNGSIYKINNGWLSNITLPSTPQQIYPINNSNFEQTTVDFEWERLNYSLTRFQVSTDSLFNSFYVLINPGNGDTTFYGNNLYIENNKTVPFPLNQKYFWRVRSENKMGVSDWSDTWSFTTYYPNNVDEKNIPVEFNLSQNYPNPFNPSTKIKFTIPNVTLSGVEGSRAQLKVFDVLGNEIATLVDEYKTAGNYEVKFIVGGDSRPDIVSAVYFYRLSVGSFSETKKMILLR
ncbi:MAG: YCF48-related protein [Ignavibacteriota bacterium]